MHNHYYLFIVIQLLIYVKVFEHTTFLKYYVIIIYKILFLIAIDKFFKVVKKRDAKENSASLDDLYATTVIFKFYF